MQKFRFILIGVALAGLTTGALWAQTYETGPAFEEETARPEVSGVFKPMEITTQNVPWNGQGSVTISYNMGQRGTVWLVVYEVGSTETGARGPGGAAAPCAPIYTE